MKRMFLSWLLLAGSLVTLNAQDLDAIIAAKVDSILALQKKTYEEVQYVDPLIGKKYGFELNPARFLLGSAEKIFTISGTVSLFDVDRKAEVAIPFTHNSSKHNDESMTDIDLQYRRFIGKHQNGFYLSGGVRYTHSKYRDEEYHYDYSNGNYNSYYTYDNITDNKIGAMFGIGYRYIAQSGFYWGASLVAGRYIGKNHRNHGDFNFGNNIILDVELLKFGFTF